LTIKWKESIIYSLGDLELAAVNLVKFILLGSKLRGGKRVKIRGKKVSKLTLAEAIAVLEAGLVKSIVIIWGKEDGFDFRIEAEHFHSGNANFVIYDERGGVIASACNSQDEGEEEPIPFTEEGFREFAEMANENGLVMQ